MCIRPRSKSAGHRVRSAQGLQALRAQPTAPWLHRHRLMFCWAKTRSLGSPQRALASTTPPITRHSCSSSTSSRAGIPRRQRLALRAQRRTFGSPGSARGRRAGSLLATQGCTTQGRGGKAESVGRIRKIWVRHPRHSWDRAGQECLGAHPRHSCPDILALPLPRAQLPTAGALVSASARARL